MKRLNLVISGLFFVISCALPMWGADPETKEAPAEKKDLLDRFEAANGLFSSGQVREAAAAYGALLKEDLLPATWGKDFQPWDRTHETVGI